MILTYHYCTIYRGRLTLWFRIPLRRDRRYARCWRHLTLHIINVEKNVACLLSIPPIIFVCITWVWLGWGGVWFDVLFFISEFHFLFLFIFILFSLACLYRYVLLVFYFAVFVSMFVCLLIFLLLFFKFWYRLFVICFVFICCCLYILYIYFFHFNRNIPSEKYSKIVCSATLFCRR